MLNVYTSNPEVADTKNTAHVQKEGNLEFIIQSKLPQNMHSNTQVNLGICSNKINSGRLHSKTGEVPGNGRL